MEIRYGYGTTGTRVAGPVRVGDPLTLIIYMRSKYGKPHTHSLTAALPRKSLERIMDSTTSRIHNAVIDNKQKTMKHGNNNGVNN